jgi:hypothetical protein
MTARNRPSWANTIVPWEWRVRIWGRMALGDLDTQVAVWLDTEGNHLDRDTIAAVRRELAKLPQAHLPQLPEAVQAFWQELRDRATGRPERLDPIQQQTLLGNIGDHRAKLKRIIHEDLMDLQVFPTDASEIRSWFAWPTETSWPVSLGQACREGSGKVWVKLNIEEQEVWKPVRQHLEGNPVLAAIEKWRRATAKDIAARLSLLDALLRYVEANTSLPVWVSVNEGDSKAEGLHNHYIDLIYDQVFRTAVNVGPALSAPVGGPLPLKREQFSFNGEGNLCHYNALLLRGCAAAEREQALALLLEAHTRLSDIPQALAAGRAYQEADTQTSQVRALRSEFLNSGLDPDSRCEECQPWFQALGVQRKGLGG